MKTHLFPLFVLLCLTIGIAIVVIPDSVAGTITSGGGKKTHACACGDNCQCEGVCLCAINKAAQAKR